MFALGSARLSVCLSCGMWAMVTSPKPKPLRISTLIFGVRSRRVARYMRPPHLRMPSRSAIGPAITPGLSTKKMTGNPKLPATSIHSAALMAPAESSAPAL